MCFNDTFCFSVGNFLIWRLYLKRWYTAREEMKMDLLGVKWKGTEFEKEWPSVSSPVNADGCLILESGRIWNDKHYLYPLPTDQLLLNPNLKQNPGWDK